MAFSGEVQDAESRPQPSSEHCPSLHPTLKSRDIREAFGTDEFQILLIANTFQTGLEGIMPQSLPPHSHLLRRTTAVTGLQGSMFHCPVAQFPRLRFIALFAGNPGWNRSFRGLAVRRELRRCRRNPRPARSRSKTGNASKGIAGSHDRFHGCQHRFSMIQYLR